MLVSIFQSSDDGDSGDDPLYEDVDPTPWESWEKDSPYAIHRRPEDPAENWWKRFIGSPEERKNK